MNNSQNDHAKSKTMGIKVMETKRDSSKKRIFKSVVAVLQMIHLYQRKLKKAQSCHSRIAPWSKAIASSHDLELADGTLLIKGRSKDVGLLGRLAMYSDNQSRITEAGDRSPKSTDTSALSPRTHKCARTVKYDVSLFDSDEADNDNDFKIRKVEGKGMTNAVAGWLASKISSGKQMLSKSGKKSQVPDILDEARTRVKEPIENDDEANGREYEMKAMVPRERASEEKSNENEASKNKSLSMKRRLMKAFGKKSKPKLSFGADSDILCIKSDDENDGQDNNMINEANSEEAQAPQRKRKKMEEPMFNCPMCDRKFIESEINQHAFTCNAEPLRESRSQTKRLEKTSDFIPLNNSSDFVGAAESRTSRHTLPKEDKDFSEWQTACEKVSTGESRNPEREVLEQFLDIDVGSSLKGLAYYSARINEPSTSRDGNQRKENNYGLARKPVKPTLCSYPNSSKDRISTGNNDNNWISDDPDEATDLIDQYLENGRKKKTRIVKHRSRNRPNFVEEDDDDVDESGRKCYVCSRTMHGKSEKEYEVHVEKCIAKQESRVKGIGNEDAIEGLSLENNVKELNCEPAKENDSHLARLNQRLGNRKSWMKFDKPGEAAWMNNQANSNYVDAECNDDSPIKTFKPISESNKFNFESQFENNTSSNKRKRPKRMRKRQKYQ